MPKAGANLAETQGLGCAGLTSEARAVRRAARCLDVRDSRGRTASLCCSLGSVVLYKGDGHLKYRDGVGEIQGAKCKVDRCPAAGKTRADFAKSKMPRMSLP